MLADADEIDADLIGKDALRNDVANDLRVRNQLAVRPLGDIAKGVEAEFEMVCHDMKMEVPGRDCALPNDVAGMLGADQRLAMRRQIPA